jgi:hypothetical protein
MAGYYPENLNLNLTTMAKKLVGSEAWQHFYCSKELQERNDGFTTNTIYSEVKWSDHPEDYLDSVRGGLRSCSFFVSSLLAIFGLIDRCHTTTETTIKDMQVHDFYEIDELRPGAIVVYEFNDFESDNPDSKPAPHIGICISKDQVISTTGKTLSPVIHLANMEDIYGQKRKIESIFWHDRLN